jgi:hypothetical protein
MILRLAVVVDLHFLVVKVAARVVMVVTALVLI